MNPNTPRTPNPDLDLIRAVRDIRMGQRACSLGDIALKLGTTKTTAANRVRKAVALGHLESSGVHGGIAVGTLGAVVYAEPHVKVVSLDGELLDARLSWGVS